MEPALAERYKIDCLNVKDSQTHLITRIKLLEFPELEKPVVPSKFHQLFLIFTNFTIDYS